MEGSRVQTNCSVHLYASTVPNWFRAPVVIVIHMLSVHIACSPKALPPFCSAELTGLSGWLPPKKWTGVREVHPHMAQAALMRGQSPAMQKT
jgi:hypothetical protein